MLIISLNIFHVCPIFQNQGDMGPVGEMGLSGPTGLKVIIKTHPETCLDTVLLNDMFYNAEKFHSNHMTDNFAFSPNSI